MFNSQFLCNTVVQVTLIFVFLCVFFFTYAKNKEKEVIITNIDFLVKDIIGNFPVNLKNFLPKQKTTTEVNPDDIKVEETNKKILKKSIITVSIFVVFAILLVIFCQVMSIKSTIPFFKNFNIGKILIESLVILFFIALTEFVFITFFGSKFISVEPDKVKASILQKLYEYSQS